MGFVIRTIVTAIALWVAVALVSGIRLAGGSTGRNALVLIIAALVIGVINAFLKPIIKVLGCPLYVLTLGLFALVVNALLLELASWVCRQLHVPFHVDGFWSAFWGAIIIAIVSWLLNLFVPDRYEKR
jgi:putative membrane protein